MINLCIPQGVCLSLSPAKKEKAYFIIDKLYFAPIKNRRYSFDSFIPLGSKTLLNLLGSCYKEILTKLEQLKIIESDNHYILHKKSKGYRIALRYRETPTESIRISGRNLLNKINDLKSKRIESYSKNKAHRHLLKCLSKLEIEKNKAKEYIYSNIADYERSQSYSIAVDLIGSQDFFFVVDKVAGRVHNNVTNLASDLRGFLKYDAKKLVEIDLCNSQPFLFNLLIQEYLVNKFLPYVYDQKTMVSGLSKDVIKYFELTSEGKLYEYLMKESQFTGNRKEFKLRTFQNIFYSKNKENYIYKEMKVFSKLFPTVAKAIKYFKKDDYKNLAIRLQQTEADIMINKIIPILADKNIFSLTIHDSILTTQEHVKEVEFIMLSEFKNQLGFTPKLKIKYY